MFNNAYVVAPNLGPQHFGPEAYPIDVGGGKSMIVDFRGEILVQREFVAADSFVSELLDIEALRRYRASNGFGKWLKDLRTEQYAVIYEQPIYPKNQYLDVAPTVGWHEREVAILDRNIEELRRRGALVAPSGISASADELEPAVR